MKNRSIILSSLACLLFSTVVTYQKPAHAQIHLPAPVVSAQTLATMAGLYAFAYYGKGWVKKVSESNVAYVSGVEKLDEYNALRALAKMADSGFWALVSFVLYDVMILHGYPAATANAAVTAFMAGLTGSLMFVDVPARFITLYKTFSSAHAAGNHGYARMHDVPNTTRLDCGPLNESCKYEQPKNGTVAQNHADEFSLLPSRETMTNLLYDYGLMYIGYHAGLSAYKAGKAYSTAAVTAYVPNFKEQEIYQAKEEYMRIAYVVRKMLGKMIESYMPGAVRDYAVKPLVLMQPDQTLEQSDASFYAGLFSEIFTYVPWGDHKKLWHEVWG